MVSMTEHNPHPITTARADAHTDTAPVVMRDAPGVVGVLLVASDSQLDDGRWLIAEEPVEVKR